jgi:hypothetical protein
VGGRRLVHDAQRSADAAFFRLCAFGGNAYDVPMPLIRMPSKALIDALGWDAIQELEAFVDDAAGAGVGSVQPELKPPVGAFHDLP